MENNKGKILTSIAKWVPSCKLQGTSDKDELPGEVNKLGLSSFSGSKDSYVYILIH